MTIRPKTAREIDSMKDGGVRLSEILEKTYQYLQIGVSLKEVDTFIHQAILKHEGKPSFLGYHGYPAASCLSVNDAVVHGIPTDYLLKEGDMIGVDVGFLYSGYHTDAAFTKVIGTMTEKQHNLIEVTKKSLSEGIEAACAGNSVEDIGLAIESFVTKHGSYGIVRDLTGHGIGMQLQEPPEIPNYYVSNKTLLINGMTLAIEPMITLGDWKVTTDSDDWTIRTKDKSLAAHFETTIVINDNDPLILVPFPLHAR